MNEYTLVSNPLTVLTSREVTILHENNYELYFNQTDYALISQDDDEHVIGLSPAEITWYFVDDETFEELGGFGNENS